MDAEVNLVEERVLEVKDQALLGSELSSLVLWQVFVRHWVPVRSVETDDHSPGMHLSVRQFQRCQRRVQDRGQDQGD